MKRIKSFLIIIILFTPIFSCKRIFKRDKTEVYGKVTDIKTGKPIDSVKIEIFRSSWSLFNNYHKVMTEHYTYTDEYGEFDIIFEQDDVYDYSIRPVKTYYVYLKNNDKEKKIRNGVLQKRNFKLTHYGNTLISGTVTEKRTNKQLKNAEVTIKIYNDSLNVLAENITDADGKYEISFLQEFYFDDDDHNYVMNISLNGYYSIGFNPNLCPDKTNIQNFEMENIKK